MLDSCKYKDNKKLDYPESGGVILESTKQWILTNVRKAQKDSFAGMAAQNGDDVYTSSGYALLQSGRFESLARYVNTMIEDPPPSNIHVILPVGR
jgi:hypothetical protein